jgi:hypothetical protein
MPGISPPENFGKFGNTVRHNALPIVILAVAIGGLLASRVDAWPELAKRVRNAGQSLRQWIGKADNTLDTAKYQVRRKNLAIGEPMAGWGA